MSEASQQMVKQQVIRRSVNLKNCFIETQGSSTLTSSQEDVQRLRKLTRLIQSNKPLITDSQDLISHLKDEHLPNQLKLYLLQSNPNFLRETHSKMQVQSQLNIPDERLNSRQQRTRNNYQLLLDICDGSDKLEELLQEESGEAEITFRDLKKPIDKQREREFADICDKIFDGLEEQGLNSDNFELKQDLLEKLELRNLEATVNEQLGGIETSWSEEEWEDQEEEVNCDSMYLSQQLNISAADAVPHSSTPLRVIPESRLKFKPLQDEDEEECNSRVEASNLGDNLGLLNSLMNTSESIFKIEATEVSPPLPIVESITEDNHIPVAEESEIYPMSLDETKVAVEPTPDLKTEAESTIDDLDIDLNDFLEPMDEEVELISQKTENKNKAEQVKVNSPQKGNTCKNDLELLSEDFKDFLEPMAEEVALISQQKQDEFKDFLEPMAEELELMSKQRKEMLSPKIETEKKTLLVIPTENSSRTVSPDIFNSDSLSPWKPQGKSLAAKLAAKTKACTPPNSVSLNSPENRKRTNPLAQDKSPSIFDLYLNRMRGRGRLAKAAETLHRMTSTNTSIPLAKDDEDSPIARRPSKRKIVISSDDEEEQKPQVAETQADYESDDYEQIPNTQMVFSLT